MWKWKTYQGPIVLQNNSMFGGNKGQNDRLYDSGSLATSLDYILGATDNAITKGEWNPFAGPSCIIIRFSHSAVNDRADNVAPKISVFGGKED
jgi:hypothetical protein